MISVKQTWQELKSIAANKALSIQYRQTSEIYDVFAIDGQILHSAEIYLDEVPYTYVPGQAANDTDKADFETNFKSTANKPSGGPKNSSGSQISAPTFEDTGGVYPKWVGHLYDVTAGATNIFDELITTEQQLRGGWYEMMDVNAAIGDYIEESVIDKDDVLGYFSTYGYTVGVDVLELKKYVETEYINPLQIGNRQVFQANSTFAIVAGLYTRTVYHSVGTVDLKLKVTTLAYE